VYVDLKAAFDSVDCIAFLLLLHSLEIPPKIVELLKALYTGAVSCVRADEDLSEWFDMLRGVRQGFTIAPNLFCSPISDLDFADDVAFLTEKLQVLLLALEQEARPFGLVMNWNKAKIQSALDQQYHSSPGKPELKRGLSRWPCRRSLMLLTNGVSDSFSRFHGRRISQTRRFLKEPDGNRFSIWFVPDIFSSLDILCSQRRILTILSPEFQSRNSKELVTKKGRPRRTWLHTVEDDLKPLSIGLHMARHRVLDGEAWHQLVTTAQPRSQGHALLMMIPTALLMMIPTALLMMIPTALLMMIPIRKASWLLRQSVSTRTMWNDYVTFVIDCL